MNQETRKITFPAIKVTQKIGDFFIASLDAEDLVDISFKDVRRMAEEQRDVEKFMGIQRPVNTKRIKEIKKYIEGGDATFPTSVILSVDGKCAEYKELENGFGELTLSEYNDIDSEDDTIPYNKIAKVLDGQHRIAAFLNENHEFDFTEKSENFQINVSIFIGADISEQANIFATVNLAQTKVNKNLVYDLTELSKHRSPYKTCHNVAVMLDGEPSSPLFKRIKRLGTATPGREFEPLTQAAFVEELVRFISIDPVDDRNKMFAEKSIQQADSNLLRKAPFRNLFLNDQELDIAEILYNYFNAVKRKWPNSWEAIRTQGNLLPKSNAFKALMRYLRHDVYIKAVNGNCGEIPSVDDFYEFFAHNTCSDEDFIARNFPPGSGGQSVFLKLLRGIEDISSLEEKQ